MGAVLIVRRTRVMLDVDGLQFVRQALREDLLARVVDPLDGVEHDGVASVVYVILT
jgi:hypothetical protein